jgi:Ser/Thr protein kinase RdoA (MazF antagonist)
MHFDWRVVDVAHAISSLYINLEKDHNDKLLQIKTFLNGIGKVIKYTKNEIISLPDIVKLVIVKLFESTSLN